MLIKFVDRLIDYIWYCKDMKSIELSGFKNENITEKTLKQAAETIRKKFNNHLSVISTD